MAGGLLNLVSTGNQSVFLTGNPTKTFFKSTYKQYTNFGLQKFRIDFNGQRALRLTEDSTFVFTVPRYADLLMDTFFCITLPHVWSPLNGTPGAAPTTCEDGGPGPYPYEFKWINDIGSQMIRTVRFSCGGQLIQEFSGQYLSALVQRDFSEAKKHLYNKMTGNVEELYNPRRLVTGGGRQFEYPNAVPTPSEDDYNKIGPQPSIRGRQLYIPLNIWFTMAAKMAFPLVSTQYVSLQIEVVIRPISELFTIMVPSPDAGGQVRRAPNFVQRDQQLKLFLQPPPYVQVNGGASAAPSASDYPSEANDWNANPHLIATYCFLSRDESACFAGEPQRYLTTQVHETTFVDAIGTKKLRLDSLGVVKDYMWFFQRGDVKARNEWSNYSNWAFQNQDPATLKRCMVTSESSNSNLETIYRSQLYQAESTAEIMTSWAFEAGGKFRENPLDAGVLQYADPYARSEGAGKDGLYSYDFCLHTSPYDFQPSGGMDMSKFNKLEMDIETIQPPPAGLVQYQTVCNADGNVVGTIKPAYGIYEYGFNMHLMEERYNVLVIENGMAGLEFAR